MRFPNSPFILLGAIAATISVVGLVGFNGKQVHEPADTTEPVQLRFGIYQTDKATELYRKFSPVLDMLEQELSESLGDPVDIELCIFKTYEEGLNAVVNGEVDISRLGPASYVKAHEANPDVVLLAKEAKKGKSTFKGVICVREESTYETLEELRGCRFAFGDPQSTIGRYLSQSELLDVGLTSDEFETIEYLGQHDKVAMAVQMGDFDAGALKESTFNKMNTEGSLRVLHSFDNITKPWVARAGLDSRIVVELRASLLEATDEEALGSLKASGFLPASHEDYRPIQSAMHKAIMQFDRTTEPK